MKKFLALILSFSLLSNSFLPVYAEGISGGLIRSVTKTVPELMLRDAKGVFSFTPWQIRMYEGLIPQISFQHDNLMMQLSSQAPYIADAIPHNLSLSNFLSGVSNSTITGPASQVGALLSNMNLAGLVAQPTDLPIFASIQQQFKGTFVEPMTTLTLARIHLRAGNFKEYQSLINQIMPFRTNVSSSGTTGSTTATVAENSLSNPLIESAEPLQDYLSQFGSLTTLTGDLSDEATQFYVGLGNKPAEELSQEINPNAAVTVTEQGIKLPERGAVTGKVTETPAPVVLGQNPLPALSDATVASSAITSINGESALPAAQVTQKVPKSLKERVFNYTNSLLERAQNTLTISKDDNKKARLILNKPHPLSTHLRDVVLSDAAGVLKIQALSKLYEQGVFNDFLASQPHDVIASVIEAKTEAQRGRALYRLYQTKYLEEVLNGITDVQEQGSILKELEEVISAEGWEEEKARAYAAEDRLPLRGRNFNGNVPSVPEADKEVILGVVRPDGYAKSNASAGVASKEGTFYQNNIPFYYRNSRGELSSEPVGILTQVPATLYGRFLSAIHLAGKPGLTIPEGMVLALDEKGQWKFFTPKGNLAIVEANKHSAKYLQEVDAKGSARVHLDTSYSTTDLLAMAHLLEANPTLNLELALNTPHSLNPFLTVHALFVGNDAGNTLTGPFKESLKTAAQGIVNMVTNLLSGVGYMTPIAGGYAMPTMSRWGNAKTTKIIYASAAAALAYSVFGLGMYGTVDPTSLPLPALAIPTVALVLGASLANSFIPTFLNFYKDPAARTAANLEFSTNKQISRLALSGIIAMAAMGGLNWTIVAPIGLGLLGISYALFRNTPMFIEAKASKAQTTAVEKKKDPNEAEYIREYQEFRNQLPEMRAIKSRVKMVYASYAASLMVLGQSANAVLPDGWGQGFITACMLATLGVRMTATKLVKKNIMSDDQLTGLSLPTLALSGIALALLPYSGPLALLTGAAGILHYMATAVPGQLDAARMQNIVTAEMQQRKQKVLDDASLTPAEKEEAIKRLEAEEKVWSAQASKDYSLYNSRGLWGIGVAAAAAFLFEDFGPQWTQNILEWVSNIYPGSTPSLSLNRLLFGYSAGVATALAMKNTHLTRDGINFFRKKKPITMENIEANLITPREFNINEKNAKIQLGDITGKRMKELEPKLVEYGVYSEQKMTVILTQLQAIHNRLVAISAAAGEDLTRAAFQREADMVTKFAEIMNQPQNDFSVMLHREFDKLQKALFEDGKIRENPSYVEENIYKLPTAYSSYSSARRVLSEMDQMAYTLQSGAVIDYQQFIDYMLRAREDLLTYEKYNPADSVRVNELRRKIDNLCTLLAKQDKEQGLLDILPTDTPNNIKGKQDLRDMLNGYLE